MDHQMLQQRFAALTTAHLADACIRAQVPVRCASALVRAVVPGSRLTGCVCPAQPSLQTLRVPNDIPPEQIDWSKYLPEPGFHVLPRRWVVEQTFAWLLFNRWLSRDYERLCTTSETRIYLAMIGLMLHRLVRMR